MSFSFNRAIKIIALILFLTSIIASPIGLKAQEEKPVVVVFAKGMLEADVMLEAMMGNITSVEWRVFTDTITYEDIKDAKMLIWVGVDTAMNITDDEVAAIVKWWSDGGKTLWVTGDSDYKGGDYMRIDDANKILEAVGSVLRNEHTEATDPVVNVGGRAYRVAGIVDPEPPLQFLKAGVNGYVLFHGPGPVVAFDGSKWYKLESEKPKDRIIYVIATTSEEGAIEEFVPPLPEAHDLGEVGKKVLMAAEIFPEKKNIAILSTEAPFDHYQGMWAPEYKGQKLYGPQFITNIINWGTAPDEVRIPTIPTVTVKETLTETRTTTQTVTSTVTVSTTLTSTLTTTQTVTKTLQPDLTMYYAAIIVLVIIIVILAVIAFRK